MCACLGHILAIETRHHKEPVALVVGFRLAVALLDNGILTAQHLKKVVSVPTGRLEEAALNPFTLGNHHIKHGTDLALVGKDLTVVHDSIAGFNLLGHRCSYCI